MNKETLKEYLCWLIDKGYIFYDNGYLEYRFPLDDKKNRFTWYIDKDGNNCVMNEFLQEKREQKINEILK